MASLLIVSMSGGVYREIREAAGYSRADFARYLKQLKEQRKLEGHWITTDDGLIHLEKKQLVPDKYISPLRLMLGATIFDKHCKIIKEKYPDELEYREE